jgi:hypothetical protein
MQRARAEMDMAQDAMCETAAEAHMRLSGLHMDRAKQLTGGHAESDFGRPPLR